VNQIGSISESIAAVKMAKEAGWGVMTSHRSGEVRMDETQRISATTIQERRPFKSAESPRLAIFKFTFAPNTPHNSKTH
jgi:hypothetical protein